MIYTSILMMNKNGNLKCLPAGTRGARSIDLRKTARGTVMLNMGALYNRHGCLSSDYKNFHFIDETINSQHFLNIQYLLGLNDNYFQGIFQKGTPNAKMMTSRPYVIYFLSNISKLWIYSPQWDTYLGLENKKMVILLTWTECYDIKIVCDDTCLKCDVVRLDCNAFRLACNAFRLVCNAFCLVCNAFRLVCNAFRLVCNAFRLDCKAFRLVCNAFRLGCNDRYITVSIKINQIKGEETCFLEGTLSATF